MITPHSPQYAAQQTLTACGFNSPQEVRDAIDRNFGFVKRELSMHLRAGVERYAASDRAFDIFLLGFDLNIIQLACTYRATVLRKFRQPD
jgi:hypothetical protein